MFQSTSSQLIHPHDPLPFSKLKKPVISSYNFQDLGNEDEDKLFSAVHALITAHLVPRAISHYSEEQRNLEIHKILLSVRRVGNISNVNKPRPICVRFDHYQHKMDVFLMAPKLKFHAFERHGLSVYQP